MPEHVACQGWLHAAEPERNGPSFSTTCVVDRLGHGDPDTRDNATRPTVVRAVAYLADQFIRRRGTCTWHAVETSGRTPRTGPVECVRVVRLHARSCTCLSL